MQKDAAGPQEPKQEQGNDAILNIWFQLQQIVLTTTAKLDAETDKVLKEAVGKCIEPTISALDRISDKETLQKLLDVLKEIVQKLSPLPREQFEGLRYALTIARVFHSYICMRLVGIPSDPSPQLLIHSPVVMRFPRLFMPLFHREDECMVPSICRMWAQVGRSPMAPHEYTSFVGINQLRQRLRMMMQTDQEQEEEAPEKLMNLYIKKWMDTYLMPDKEKYDPEKAEDADVPNSSSNDNMQYIVLHGGYLVRIHLKKKAEKPKGLKFIFKIFH